MPLMKTITTLVTPDLAAAYLKKNLKNRRLRPSSVDKLAQSIKEGQWALTHQGIAIAEDGTLLDGQHRLMAIVKAGQAVKVNVTTDVPLEAQRYIDIGQKRDLADRRRFVDDPNLNKKISNIIMAYFRLAKRMPKMTENMDIVDNFFLEYSEPLVWAATMGMQKRTFFGRADMLAALTGYSTHDHAAAEAFHEAMVSGAGLATGSPVLKLRNLFVEGNYTLQNSNDGTIYWKATKATQLFDEDNNQVAKLNQASTDWFGNDNDLLNAANSERAKKGIQTRKVNGKW